MLRRLLATVHQSNVVGKITRSSLAHVNTQKVYYHPTCACWREIELDKNPFYDKYKEKLHHVVSNARQEDGSSEDKHNSISTTIEHSGAIDDKVQSTLYSFTKPPQLDKMMKVELLVNKSADEITQIWKTYHSDKDSVCAIIPAKQYDEMMSTAQDCPMVSHY